MTLDPSVLPVALSVSAPLCLMLCCEVRTYRGSLCLRVESPPLSPCDALLCPPLQIHQEWLTLHRVTPFHLLWGQGGGFHWEAELEPESPIHQPLPHLCYPFRSFLFGFILLLFLSPLRSLAHFLV